MTHADEGSEHGVVMPPLPYSAEEWRGFRAVDKTAAAYIVGLMGGIFTVGLVLYLIVLWSVST
jgi:hypothetical protein